MHDHTQPHSDEEFTVLGDVADVTGDKGQGFSDDGGHAGYKQEGGARGPASYEELPPR
jgi:hypothetical protein